MLLTEYVVSKTLNVGVDVAAVHCALIIRPTNTSVDVGDTARFNCSTNLTFPVNWYKYEPTSNEGKLLYTVSGGNDTLRERFEVLPAAEGRYDLLISNTQLSDEGIYECRERAGHGQTVVAYLSVKQLPRG